MNNAEMSCRRTVTARIIQTSPDIEQHIPQPNLKCPIENCGMLCKCHHDFMTHIKAYGLNVIALTANWGQNDNIQCSFPLKN